MLKKRKFWISGAVLAIALVALLFNAFGRFSIRNLSVAELQAQDSTVNGEEVRVTGNVVEALPLDARTRTSRFVIQDKDGLAKLTVIYRGALPDTFKIGAEVVVRGSLNPQGIFEGKELQARCASKYIPQL